MSKLGLRIAKLQTKVTDNNSQIREADGSLKKEVAKFVCDNMQFDISSDAWEATSQTPDEPEQASHAFLDLKGGILINTIETKYGKLSSEDFDTIKDDLESNYGSEIIADIMKDAKHDSISKFTPEIKVTIENGLINVFAGAKDIEGYRHDDDF